MFNDVKIVIGANYGDEGKGLIARHLAVEGLQTMQNPIIILHNGTAQRGHTVDYNPKDRHVYHHFGSGSRDGVPTYFAKTFLIHPMEFRREWTELFTKYRFMPKCFCDYDCKFITPFDMLIDRITEDYIALKKGEREYGSCGFGSWCATERFADGVGFPIGYFLYKLNYEQQVDSLYSIWNYCVNKLLQRKVDVMELKKYSVLFTDKTYIANLINKFLEDLEFFRERVEFAYWDLFKRDSEYKMAIFENGQGLGLDQNVDNEWHTTSNTGTKNPSELLSGLTGYIGEAIYVTRTYLTRHGEGPLEEQVSKKNIAASIEDKTNVYNIFQGGLRYGYLNDKDQKARIEKDWNILSANPNFSKSIALTHFNEFSVDTSAAKYISTNPFSVFENN